MKDIAIRVDHAGPKNEIVVVHIEGIIDTNTSRELNRALGDQLVQNQFKIVIDLEHVSYISSAGWGIFIGEIKAIQTNQGDLKLAALSPEVEEVYQLLEFYNILKAYDNVAEAVRDF